MVLMTTVENVVEAQLSCSWVPSSVGSGWSGNLGAPRGSLSVVLGPPERNTFWGIKMQIPRLSP